MQEPEPQATPVGRDDDGPAPWREPVRGGHPDDRLASRPGSELLAGMLSGEVPAPPLTHLTGMTLIDFSPGRATFSMPLSPWLAGADGLVPLGPLTIPVDAAMACAIISHMPPHVGVTTTELALRQVRPLRPGGRVLAHAKVLELGPPVALAEATLTDEDGTLIAHADSLCVRLPNLAAPDTLEHAVDTVEGVGPDPWERPLPAGAGGSGSGSGGRGDGSTGALGWLTGLRQVSSGSGAAAFALPATGWLCAPPPGRVQGGAVATLADAAVTAAIRTTERENRFVPVELKLNYLRPLASDGRDARAEAQVIHGGRRMAVASAQVTDAGGRKIAVATGSAIADG